jgi:hypothetical protein
MLKPLGEEKTKLTLDLMFKTTAFENLAKTFRASRALAGLSMLSLGALSVLGGCAVSSPYPTEPLTSPYPAQGMVVQGGVQAMGSTPLYPAPMYSAPIYPASISATMYYEPYPVYLPPPGYYVAPVVVVPLIVRAPLIVQTHYSHPAPRPVMISPPPIIVSPRIQAPHQSASHLVAPVQVIAARSGAMAGQSFQHSAGQAFGRDHIAAGQQAASSFRAQPNTQLAHHSGPHASSQPSNSKSGGSRRR